MVFQSMELLLEREGAMKIRYSNTRIVNDYLFMYVNYINVFSDFTLFLK